MVSAAAEHPRRKASMVAQGDGKFLRLTSESLQTKKKAFVNSMLSWDEGRLPKKENNKIVQSCLTDWMARPKIWLSFSRKQLRSAPERNVWSGDPSDSYLLFASPWLVQNGSSTRVWIKVSCMRFMGRIITWIVCDQIMRLIHQEMLPYLQYTCTVLWAKWRTSTWSRSQQKYFDLYFHNTYTYLFAIQVLFAWTCR